MRSLVLDVDDNVYDKLVNFLKIFPRNKIKIVEEITCSEQLKNELAERKKEIAGGEVMTHEELWESAGL